VGLQFFFPSVATTLPSVFLQEKSRSDLGLFPSLGRNVFRSAVEGLENVYLVLTITRSFFHGLGFFFLCSLFVGAYSSTEIHDSPYSLAFLDSSSLDWDVGCSLWVAGSGPISFQAVYSSFLLCSKYKPPHPCFFTPPCFWPAVPFHPLDDPFCVLTP